MATVDKAMKVNSTTEGWLEIAGERYRCSFVQLLPDIDDETQQAQVLFWIEGNPKRLLLGAYVEISISLPPYEKRVAIKRTALTMMQGEWVVFVHKDQEDEGREDPHHDDHDGEKSLKSSEKGEHGDEEEHGDEDGDEHHELPYTPQVVEIISYSGEYVSIKGIDDGAEYVSEGVYLVKSKILKSSLGEHGH